jgi:uncharacterized surface protein with fasciclin (FAS1) repeats
MTKFVSEQFNLARRASLVVVALALTACASLPPPPVPMGDAIAGRADLSELAKLIDAAGLRSVLNQGGPYTVFAPSNEAVSRLSASAREALTKDPARLRAVLTYHVLPAQVKAADVKDGPAKTLEGQNLPLARAGTFITADDAMVQQADLPSANGVIHVVDRVITLPAPRR